MIAPHHTYKFESLLIDAITCDQLIRHENVITPDLATFKHGDLSVIGQKGIDTAEYILRKMFCGPLLKDRTGVHATHRVDLCTHIADQVIEITDGVAKCSIRVTSTARPSCWHQAGEQYDGTRCGSSRLRMKHKLICYFVIGIVPTALFTLSQCGLLLILFVTARSLLARVLQKVCRANFRFYNVTPAERLMNRLTSDIGMLRRRHHLAPPDGRSKSRGLKFLHSLRRLEMASLSPLMSNFGILVDGLATIRAFNAQLQFQNRNIEVADAFQEMDHFNWSVQSWLLYRFDALSDISAFALTVYGQLQMDIVSVERVVELLELEEGPTGDVQPPAVWPSNTDKAAFSKSSLDMCGTTETCALTWEVRTNSLEDGILARCPFADHDDLGQ
ncbi:ABC transporter type 1, transmembrane domain-containing protein [Microdochium bolleyi]|uniref:ABC transporter type 1, transmembrane domain-containing protein n=1 Tax=Microdochium bolleyi TaxID=196109 RepID=A0A136IJV8_9PEZI|nr:ABC transporter type 1, transmembrane domain-containing protein [Microdochium bolleyi]